MSPETQDENPAEPLSHNELFANSSNAPHTDSFHCLRNAQARDQATHTDRLHDTEPYSEHWSTLTPREKEKLKPYLKGHSPAKDIISIAVWDIRNSTAS